MPDPALPFADRLAAAAALTESVLADLLRDEAGGRCPPLLMAAMRHATLGGGKRLRPFLVGETAGLFGLAPQAAARAGAALEMLHVYSLVHDDLPAMDDDDLRRGRPTVHRAYDEATAILVGDGLQTLAFATLADPSTHPDAAVRLDLVRELALRAGIDGMVGGQMRDLAAEGRFAGARPPLGAEDVRVLQSMKTGALFRAAVAFGAILGRAAPAERAALDAFATALGAAFQVADDILDLEATAADLGKATGKDDARGKATLANILGLGPAKSERDRLADEAVAALAPFGARADGLRQAALFAAQRRF